MAARRTSSGYVYSVGRGRVAGYGTLPNGNRYRFSGAGRVRGTGGAGGTQP